MVYFRWSHVHHLKFQKIIEFLCIPLLLIYRCFCNVVMPVSIIVIVHYIYVSDHYYWLLLGQRLSPSPITVAVVDVTAVLSVDRMCNDVQLNNLCMLRNWIIRSYVLCGFIPSPSKNILCKLYSRKLISYPSILWSNVVMTFVVWCSYYLPQSNNNIETAFHIAMYKE